MTLNLLFVGDGPRDEAVVPRLIERVLGVEVTAEFEAWKELRLHGRGLGKKLLYMLRRARDRGANGVVATVDVDKFTKNDKLGDLKVARSKDREGGHKTPAAIGEADPHLEAWLLDDDVAVRASLGLPSTAAVEAPTKVKSPKDELDRLYKSCNIDRSTVDVLAAIARQLVVDRCGRAKYTGFEAFAEDIRAELGPLCGD
jgi:hypothetical protein